MMPNDNVTISLLRLLSVRTEAAVPNVESLTKTAPYCFVSRAQEPARAFGRDSRFH